MASYRFMTDNLVSQAQLSASSETDGLVGLAVKLGQGAAAAVSGGVYTGTGERTFTVQIDSLASGAEVGQATFRWKHSDSTSWEATGVTTSTSFVNLADGVKIKWVSGSGADFVLGDSWRILCTKPFGRPNLSDWDRNTVYRSKSLDAPNWLKADLGEAKNVKACAILDHNFTSGATITLQANTVDAWTAPAYSQALTYHQGVIVYFLDQTYRWWRLEVSDQNNPDEVLTLSQFYLGGYEAPELVIRRDLTRRLDASDPLLYATEGLSFQFLCPSQTALEELVAIFKGQLEQSNRRMRPFFFCLDVDQASDWTWLVRFEPTLNQSLAGPESYLVDMNLKELERKYV